MVLFCDTTADSQPQAAEWADGGFAVVHDGMETKL